MKRFTKLLRQWFLGGAGPRVKLHLLALIWARDSRRPRLGRYVAARLQRRHGVFVSSKARFPRSLSLVHPVGIVIGEGVKLGERVIIYQNVTIGGARRGDWQAGNYPEVGDDTVLFAGATVIGDIKIGTNCVIGANSVVTNDIPDNSVAVGAPARVVGQTSPAAPEQEMNE